MLILKGDTGKSKVVDAIVGGTNSIAVVYYEDTLPFISYYIDSKAYSLVDLRKYILQLNFEIKSDSVLDYIVIYTNKKEDEISGLIGWLNQHQEAFKWRDIIVTCKN